MDNIEKEEEESLTVRITKLCFGSVFFIAAIILESKNIKGWYFYCAYLVSYTILGFGVLRESALNIVHGEVFDENFLMGLATIGAAALGEYKEAVAVMLFYMIGETLQDLAVDSSRKNIEKAMKIAPDTARIIVDGSEKEISPECVKVGDVVRIKAGERIPVDGKVINGVCSTDTSALTGESIPVPVSEGSNVLSGSIVLDSVIEVVCEVAYSDCTVSKILKLVEKARKNKAKTEKFITKFARIYTPVVVCLALILAVVPSLLTGSWSLWVHRSLSFLVISCPCALVISIPLAFFAGIGGLASQGILVKGGNHIENLAKSTIFAFDKTGTLTTGELKVFKTESNNESLFLSVSKALEEKSSHPIAKAVVSYCKDKKCDSVLIKSFVEKPGFGIVAEAKVSDKFFNAICGNRKLLEEQGIDTSSFTFENCYSGSAVYTVFDGEILGVFHISDTVKENSKNIVSLLKKLGVSKTVMLSGDREENALSIASETKIDEVHSSLLPQEKVEEVEKLKTQGVVTYVGDGINDAPVLIVSDCGISMGSVGSDSAVEASGIVIIKDDIAKVADALRGAKKTLRIARQNVVIALVIKVLCMILSASGTGTMALAVFADVGVCLICIINSIRAMRF